MKTKTKTKTEMLPRKLTIASMIAVAVGASWQTQTYAAVCNNIASDTTVSNSTFCQTWTAGNLSVTGTGIQLPSTTTAIYANGVTGATLTNSGTISSSYYGVRLTGSTNLTSVENTGLIRGSYVLNVETATVGTLTNSGTITGRVALYNGGVIHSLVNTEVMSGTNTGLMNYGTINSFTNSGTISGGVFAIDNQNSALGPITNSGLIAGNIGNQASSALTINGGTGTTFGTLTGFSGGIGVADIGNITSVGNLIFGSGNQLLNNNITVDSGNGNVTNNGVLQVNNPLAITGNYAQAANASLLIGVSNPVTVNGNVTDTGYGRLVVNGNAVITSGSTINLKSLGYSFAQGQRYVVMASNGAGTNYNASALHYSAAGYSVTGAVQTDSSDPTYSNLVLTLGSNAPNNNATTNNASSALGGLFKYSGTDAAMLSVFNPAAALNNTAAANKAGAQLSPAAVTGAASKAVDTATQAIGNVVTTHLDGFRLAQAGGTGISAGERSADIAMWGQVFGGRATQGMRDNVSGYRATYNGLMIGADGLVSDQVRAGAVISSAKTSVASEGDNTGSWANVNNYGLTAYASYTGEPWYINVMASAARQQYHSVRSINYTGFSGIADGRFNGSQYLTSVQAGYPLNLDAWLPGATLTPIVGLSYSTLRQDAYTEAGGNGAALSVGASSSNSLKSELGAKLERSFNVSYGKLLTSAQLGWRHEYKDNATQIGASFVADSTGATTFTTRSATPVADLAVLNLGVTLVQSNNTRLTGKYTLETGGGYTAHTGSVQVRWQY